MGFHDQLNSTTFDALLNSFFDEVQEGVVSIYDTLVEAEIACYPFGEIITIDLPGEHYPSEQIATKMGDVLVNGFSAIATGDTLPCKNCVNYRIDESAKINIYRSKTGHAWSETSNQEGIIVLIRTYENGTVSKVTRQYLPDNKIPGDILDELNEHL